MTCEKQTHQTNNQPAHHLASAIGNSMPSIPQMATMTRDAKKFKPSSNSFRKEKWRKFRKWILKPSSSSSAGEETSSGNSSDVEDSRQQISREQHKRRRMTGSASSLISAAKAVQRAAGPTHSSSCPSLTSAGSTGSSSGSQNNLLNVPPVGSVPHITTRCFDSSASSSCSDDSDDVACFNSKCDSPFHDTGRRLIDQVVNCNLDQVYQLLFTPSKFFVDTLRTQNISGISVGTWLPPNAHGERTRTTHFTVPVTGPGFTKIAATQYLRILACSNPRQFYAVDAKMTNSGIPYGESFYVQIHYCVEKAGPNSTRLIVTADIKYVKSVWRFVRKFIEDITWSAMEKFYKALADQVLRLKDMTDEERRALMAVSEHHKPDQQEEETIRQLMYSDNMSPSEEALLMSRRKSLSSSALDQMLARTRDLGHADSTSDLTRSGGSKQEGKVAGNFLTLPGAEPTPPPRRRRAGGSTSSTPNARISKEARQVAGMTPFARRVYERISPMSTATPVQSQQSTSPHESNLTVKLINNCLTTATSWVSTITSSASQIGTWLLIFALLAATASFAFQASFLSNRLQEVETRTRFLAPVEFLDVHSHQGAVGVADDGGIAGMVPPGDQSAASRHIQVQRWSSFLQAAKAHLNAAEIALKTLKSELSVAEAEVIGASEFFLPKKNST